MSDEISNDELGRLIEVASGTAGGNLLRHYWHPLVPASLVSKRAPLSRVQILGENVVVVPDGGRYFAIAENCPHRGASLRYGYAEHGGIRCAYHGWLFSPDGECVDQPFEPAAIPVCARTYPVEESCGLLFIYMGRQETASRFPIWDMMNQRVGSYSVLLQEDLACNWVQAQENSADVTHTYFLHSKRFEERGLPDPSGFNLELTGYGFQPFEFGIIKSWRYRDPSGGPDLVGWGNPLVFPNMLHIDCEIHWRVPIDEIRTRIIILAYHPEGSDSSLRVVQIPSRTRTDGTYRLDNFFAQDSLAWETQGETAARDAEHLGASDIGVLMFRRMLLDEMEVVERGGIPMGCAANDESNAVIATREWMGGYLPMSAPPDPTISRRRDPEEVFDERHVQVSLPGSTGAVLGREENRKAN